jgi:hypothetical protein
VSGAGVAGGGVAQGVQGVRMVHQANEQWTSGAGEGPDPQRSAVQRQESSGSGRRAGDPLRAEGGRVASIVWRWCATRRPKSSVDKAACIMTSLEDSEETL